MKKQCYDCELITGILQESANNQATLSKKYEYAKRALENIGEYKSVEPTVYSFFVVKHIAAVALRVLNSEDLDE